MLNVTNPVGKDKSRWPRDNIRWPKGNAAETIDVPDLYLATTTWGRCDRPTSVADAVCGASTLAAAWLIGLAAPGRAPAVRDERCRGPLARLAGHRDRSAASAGSTATPDGTRSRRTPRCAATTSARARTRPRRCGQSTAGTTCTAGRGMAKGNGVRPPAGAQRPEPDLQPGDGRAAGAPARTDRAGVELARGAGDPRRRHGLSIAIAGSLGLIGLAAVSGAGLAAGAALLCWPPARKRIVAWAWCVITPHRVRAGCVNAWVQTRSGRLPIIWSATPTDYGERLRLWCPAGITAADLIAASEVLAAACWAAEVRVSDRCQARAPGHAGGNKKQSSRTDRADSLQLAAPSPRGRRRRGRAR